MGSFQQAPSERGNTFPIPGRWGGHAVFLGLFVLSWTTVLQTGCGRHRDEIRQLDLALTRLDSCQAVLDSLPLADIDSTRVWVGNQWQDFSLFANDSLLEITREEGAVIADVGRIRRLLKDFPSKYKGVGEALVLSRTQIEALRTALEEGATQDRNGARMDDAYVAAQVANELGFVDKVALGVMETNLFGRQAVAAADTTRARADSVAQALRGRMAARIIGDIYAPMRSRYIP